MQGADEYDLRIWRQQALGQIAQFFKNLAFTGFGARQTLQNALALNFAIAGKRPVELGAVQQQANPIAIAEETIGKGCGGVDSVFEERSFTHTNFAAPPGIEDNAHIGNTLLFELVNEQSLMMAGAGAPVDPAQRIALLILAHVKKFDAGAAFASGDEPGVDARAARADIDAPHPLDTRLDKNTPGAGQRNLPLAHTKAVGGSDDGFAKTVIAARSGQRETQLNTGEGGERGQQAGFARNYLDARGKLVFDEQTFDMRAGIGNSESHFNGIPGEGALEAQLTFGLQRYCSATIKQTCSQIDEQGQRQCHQDSVEGAEGYEYKHVEQAAEDKNGVHKSAVTILQY